MSQLGYVCRLNRSPHELLSAAMLRFFTILLLGAATAVSNAGAAEIVNLGIAQTMSDSSY
jgi:hypothetical protein